MTKRILALLLAGVLSVSLFACGNKKEEVKDDVETTEATEVEEKSPFVTETNHIKLEAICANKGYVDDDGKDIVVLYIFTTVFSNDKNYQVSSKLNTIKINDINEYKSEFYQSAVNKYLYQNWYLSSFLEDVNVGDELKVMSVYKVPAAELDAGRTIDFNISDLSDEAEHLIISSDDIQWFDSDEAVAEQMDEEGYKKYQTDYAVADAATVEKVRNILTNIEITFYQTIGTDLYPVTVYFTAPNYFTIEYSNISSYGGIFEVRVGFLTLISDNGIRRDIPYTWDGEDSLDPDFSWAYSVYE